LDRSRRTLGSLGPYIRGTFGKGREFAAVGICWRGIEKLRTSDEVTRLIDGGSGALLRHPSASTIHSLPCQAFGMEGITDYDGQTTRWRYGDYDVRSTYFITTYTSLAFPFRPFSFPTIFIAYNNHQSPRPYQCFTDRRDDLVTTKV
jgi:hypothetical protein